MKKNPLPAAYSRFGSFDQLQEDNSKRINTILTELQKGKYETGTTEQKLSDLYKLALDMKRRNKEGLAPVKPLLKQLAQASTNDDLFEIQKYLLKYGDQQFMRAGFGADEKNSTQNILNVNQGGIIWIMMPLPSRYVMLTRPTSFVCSRCMASTKRLPKRRWRAS